VRDVGGVVGKIDREEQDRIVKLRQTAREHRSTLKVSDRLFGSRSKRRKATFHLEMNTRVLGLTQAGVESLIQKKLIARATGEAFRSDQAAIQHVKDGKPLTAIGAKLLGIEWPAVTK